MENNIISKELLSNVLGEKVSDIYGFVNSDNELEYKLSSRLDIEIINIHELAYKCKEWAKDLGWTLQSGWDCHYMAKKYGHNDKGYYSTIQNKDFKSQEFKCSSEPEAIFLTCEYILNNIKQ